MVKKLIQHENSVEHIQEKDIIHSLENINKKYGAVLKKLGE